MGGTRHLIEFNAVVDIVEIQNGIDLGQAELARDI
jgi:hypothetical protein